MFAVAPTASISIIAGTPSPGIDPMPANVYVQKTLSGVFKVRNKELDAVIRRYADESGQDAVEFAEAAWLQVETDEGSAKNLSFLSDHEKDVFKTHIELDQFWVLDHAASRDPAIDQMASNNLALPGDVEKSLLHKLHVRAWEQGIQSLYYVRSKSLIRGAKMGHTAGEMPQATPQHDVVLQDRGEKIDYISNDGEICLACT
jgi:ribonucleoside-diphosphate reductase alpha chain